jgi:hypothetical protein
MRGISPWDFFVKQNFRMVTAAMRDNAQVRLGFSRFRLMGVEPDTVVTTERAILAA